MCYLIYLMPVHTCATPTSASSRLLLNTFGKSPSSIMSMLTVVVLLTIQASRFIFLIGALWNYYSFGEENSRKSDVSRTGTQCQPTSLPTAEYCLLEKHWKCSKQHLEAQIGSNNVTVTHFNNTMREFMTSSCPKDVGEDITNWQHNIRKPRHI